MIATLAGRANGYDITPERDEWSNNRKTKVCAWPECDTMIRPQATHCIQHAQMVRRMEHDASIEASIAPEYLQPIPDGMEPIWYPKMAQSERGKVQVREQVRRRLRMYFARKRRQQEPARESRTIHPLVHAVWEEFTR